MISTQKLVINI